MHTFLSALYVSSALVATPPKLQTPQTMPPTSNQALDPTGKWKGILQIFGRDSNFDLEILQTAEGLRANRFQFEDGETSEKVKTLQLEGRLLSIDLELGIHLKGLLSEDGSQVRGTATHEDYPDVSMRFLAKRGISGSQVESFSIKDNYQKQEIQIPMRDGVTLHTALYLPKDATVAHPILLQRSPYSSAPYGPDAFKPVEGTNEQFAKENYILVFQDVRGRFQSKGTFQHVRPMLEDPKGPMAIDESTDTFDTIDWLVKNVANNNGKVGISGLSYPGFYAAASLVRSHPALKAVSPQAPIMDWFVGDDEHRNGALCLDMFAFNAGGFGPETNYPETKSSKEYDFETPDGYRFYLGVGPVRNLKNLDVRNQSVHLREIFEHPNYDSYWRARNLRPHLKEVRPAVLTVGGWYDGENMFGALECFKSIQRQSPATDNHLVMGPWFHSQWVWNKGDSLGQGDWGQSTGKFYREQIEKPFFDHHLLGAADPKLPKAFVFEVGANQWRRFDVWPPTETKSVSFYFQGNGKLSKEKPAIQSGFDCFVSDPARPVPYKNDISTYHTQTYLIDDQRFAATRPDVLVYESEPLTEDLTIAGPVKVDLMVATSGTDSDWVVKLIDVHPGDEPDPLPNPDHYRNGHWQELVRADVMRGKFRNSFERPEAFLPDQPTRVAWSLNDTLHTFKKGHRVMVQVQCSWFPLVDRNPQTFVDINSAKPEDFIKATQKVYRNVLQASRIEVGVIPAK